MFMRLLSLGLAGVLLVGTGSASADDAADCKELVEKVLKAAGGEERLSKIKCQTHKAKGNLTGGEAPIPYTIDFQQTFPTKVRIEQTIEREGQKATTLLLTDGANGWVKGEEGAQDMGDDFNKQIVAALHKNWLTTVLPLKDASLKLKSLGASKIGDRDVVGIQVSAKDRPDVNLYFDAKTNLIVRSTYKSRPPMSDGDVETVQDFSDHKAIDGVQVAMKNKVTRGEKPYM